MKVALVHDWLVSYRGGEKVLELMSELYPEAPIYTLFCDRQALPASLLRRDIRPARGLSGLRRVRKLLLPCLPAMIEALPLFDYDLVLSSSSCVAKGVLTAPHAKHLCYIHSPMRYVWDQRDEYFRGLAWLPGARLAIHLASTRLRLWDAVTAERVDRFVANSRFVQARVARYYGRESTLLHPPVDVDYFAAASAETRVGGPPYFLAAGAFVSYKRFDLAIAACEALGKRLIVAGAGPYERALRAQAGPHTSFVIAPDDASFARLLAGADALLFPGVEDFGMIAIEAMASGTPVLALRRGGALDFIEPRLSGGWIEEQTREAVVAAIAHFDANDYPREPLLAHARRFSRAAFQSGLVHEINQLMGE